MMNVAFLTRVYVHESMPCYDKKARCGCGDFYNYVQRPTLSPDAEYRFSAPWDIDYIREI